MIQDQSDSLNLALIHQLGVPILILSDQGVVLAMNEGFSQISGLERPKGQALSFQDCLHADYTSEFNECLQSAQSASGEVACRFNLKNGEQFQGVVTYVRQSPTSYFLLQGQAASAENYLELNRQLAQTQKALVRQQNLAQRHESAIRGLDEFLSVLMHDIRSPLCTVCTSLQLAEEDLERRDLDGLADMLESGSCSTKRLLDFVDRLYQNIRVGQSEPVLELLDIGVLVKELEVDLLSQFRASGAKLKITGRLPKLNADRQLTRQLFQNLMQNAMKFRSPKRPLVLQFGAKQVEAGIFDIYLKDNGEGFAKEGAARLFDRYHKNSRGKGKKDENDGMGIGLATCKLIAEKHGWSIRADAEIDVGATFTVRVTTKAKVS